MTPTSQLREGLKIEANGSGHPCHKPANSRLLKEEEVAISPLQPRTVSKFVWGLSHILRAMPPSPCLAPSLRTSAWYERLVGNYQGRIHPCPLLESESPWLIPSSYRKSADMQPDNIKKRNLMDCRVSAASPYRCLKDR